MSTDVKSSEWDPLISGKKLMGADFWAPWCPYCMQLKPVFDSVAEDYVAISIVHYVLFAMRYIPLSFVFQYVLFQFWKCIELRHLVRVYWENEV
jgi:thiol-disulfide isomerase/thioredoxin